MRNFYLLDTIRDQKQYDESVLDILKAELDQRIYNYGDQFKHPYENIRGFSAYKNAMMMAMRSIMLKTKIQRSSHSAKNGSKAIVSSAYFSANREMRSLGYRILSPPWGSSRDVEIMPSLELYAAYERLNASLEKSSFAELFSKKADQEIHEFSELLDLAFMQMDIRALVLSNDMNVMERIAINRFRALRRPSVIFLHGLPGRYNKFDDGRTDHLVVWGPRIKENYVKAGHDPKRIFVSGHPYYKQLTVREIKYSLDRILVLTKSMNGGQHSGGVILTDRGNLIGYLLSIQGALKALGVKSVRFRPHPSENGEWYHRFVDKEFFVLEKAPLVQALEDSSVVIGPTSTVMLEAFYHGRHYQVFEPVRDGKCMDNYPVCPPFDGADPRIPVAKTEDELRVFLKERRSADISFWNDYIATPFNLDFMKELVT